jgi:hypothetical protein
VLRDYALRGYVIDKKRMENGAFLDEDYFEHHSGKINAQLAKEFAESEFEKYRIIQDRLFESDFDREIKKIEEKRGKK